MKRGGMMAIAVRLCQLVARKNFWLFMARYTAAVDGMRVIPPAMRPSCIAADVASSDLSRGVRDGMMMLY